MKMIIIDNFNFWHDENRILQAINKNAKQTKDMVKEVEKNNVQNRNYP